MRRAARACAHRPANLLFGVFRVSFPGRTRTYFELSRYTNATRLNTNPILIVHHRYRQSYPDRSEPISGNLGIAAGSTTTNRTTQAHANVVPSPRVPRSCGGLPVPFTLARPAPAIDIV